MSSAGDSRTSSDVLLVGDAEQVDLRSVDALLGGVERLGHPLDDELRHRAVDVAGQLDEAALEAALPRLPRQVERVDRNAVAAEARARDRTA